MRRAVEAWVVCVLLVFLGFARDAGAFDVWNARTVTLLLHDDFEGAAASPSSLIDGSGDFDPVAVVGSWSTIESHGGNGNLSPQIIQVTSGPAPAAHEGAKSLRIFRDDLGGYNGNQLVALLGTQSTNGDVIHLETMAWIGSEDDANARFQIVFVGSSGDVVTDGRAWVRPNGAGSAAIVHSGATVAQDTTVPYATDQWQKWSIDYAVGSGTFRLTVDGVSQSGLASNSAGDVAYLVIVNGAVEPGYARFDAVPEPGTSAMTIVGVLAMAARGRRR